MIIGMPVYDGVDMLDVTGPFEMFDWADKYIKNRTTPTPH